MNREQMIEEAATAMREAERYPSEPGWKAAAEFARESYRKLARVALAVFEQSSAPTDQDEREITANALMSADNRTVAEFHATRESGTGCPDGPNGQHYFAFIDPSVDYRICIDCGAPEREES